MDLKKVVNEVVEHSGGESNIRSVVHCATRLRLELNDEEKYDKDKRKYAEYSQLYLYRIYKRRQYNHNKCSKRQPYRNQTGDDNLTYSKYSK